MFRLTDQYRWALDEVALEHEPALNAAVAARVQGPWAQVRARVERSYHADRVRDWLEPQVRRWPSTLLIASPERRVALPDEVNQRFHLDKLRPFEAADFEAADRAAGRFLRQLPSSVLPLIARLAKARGLRLCFVRGKRRPNPDGSPVKQPDYLRKYIADLRAWMPSRACSSSTTPTTPG